jgi:uncharacterized membrane protein (DUF373 family)
MLILTAVVIALLAFSIIDLVDLIVRDILDAPRIHINVNNLQEMLGFVLLILIGVELLESIKTYFLEKKVHVEVVLMIAIIAIARKIIILNFKELSASGIMAIGVIFLVLCLGYYIIKRARIEEQRSLK